MRGLGLVGWIQNGMETMCQYGYPYPTSFYNPLPAYPWKVACDGMVAAGTPLGALRAAANVYYNFTGQVPDAHHLCTLACPFACIPSKFPIHLLAVQMNFTHL